MFHYMNDPRSQTL